jgi:hypothetical protein
MYAASSLVEGRGGPVANRTGLHRPVLIKTLIFADRFFRTQADPGQWTLGSAQPATVPDVRLHELILQLRDLTGESGYETITADLLWLCTGPGDSCRPGGFTGPGYDSAHQVAVVCAPDTVSALERDRYSHPHDHPQAWRRSAPPPGGDPLPAARTRPISAGGPEPRHRPRPAAATGGTSPL